MLEGDAPLPATAGGQGRDGILGVSDTLISFVATVIEPQPRRKRRYTTVGTGYTDTSITIAARIFRFARACELTIRLIILSSVTPWQARATLRIEKARKEGRERERERDLARVRICVRRNGETACEPVTHARVR